MTPAAPFWQLWAVLLAVAPGLLLSAVLIRVGRGRLSPAMLGVSMAFGAFAAFVCLLLSIAEQRLLPGLGLMGRATTVAFVFAGLVEEAAKLTVTLVFIYPYVRADSVRRIVLATAGVALGFALLENVGTVLKLASSWERIGVSRAFLTVPFHTLLGICVGYGLARAKGLQGAAAAIRIAKTLLWAAPVHALYDLPLFLGVGSPVFPTPVNHIAAAFSLPVRTFLNIWVLFVLGVLCLAALKAMVWTVRREASSHDRASAPISSRSRFLRYAGSILVAAFGIAAATIVALMAEALDHGAALTVALPGFDASLIIATFAALLIAASGWSIRTVSIAAGTVALSTAGAGFMLAVFDAARRSALAAVLLASAQLAGATGDLDQASRNTTAALVLAPDAAPVLAAHVQILERQHRYEVAYDTLSHALARHPDDASLLALRSLESANRHQDDAAEADLDRALKLEPRNAGLRHLRFSLLLAHDRVVEAEAELDKGAALGPNGTVVDHLDRAALAVRRKDANAAPTEYGEAVRLAPTEGFVWASRGRFRFDQGDFKGAASDLATAASRGNDPYVVLSLYDALSRAGMNPYQSFAFWAPLLNRIYWPGPLVELYLGQRSMPSVLAAARTGDERCEAYFYGAEWLLHQGQRGFALPMLKAAVPLCPLSFVEHDAVAAEIARLEAQFPKPHLATIPSTAVPTSAPEKAQPWIPPAVATLGGRGCDATGEAEWRFAGSAGADAAPESLKVTFSIPPLLPDAVLDVEPDKEGGSFVVTLSIPTGPDVLAIDHPGEMRVRDARFASPLDMTPFKGATGASFRASIGKDAIIRDLDVVLKGLILELPLTTGPNGPCSLFVKIDDVARNTVRNAETSWTALLAAESR